MVKNYYIQKGTDVAKDLFSEYGISVKEVSGMSETPDTKSFFSRSWPDEQGEDVYIPSNLFFKSKEIKITFVLQKNTVSDVNTIMKSFLEYIIPNGFVNYFDTYRQNGFRGHYNKSDIDSESYRDLGSYIQWSMTFTAYNGICYGFDNSGSSSIFAEVTSGTADIYFSDGTSILEVSGQHIKGLDGGFAIVCPSIYGGVSLEKRTSKLIGTYVSSNGKIYGIGGFPNPAYLFGI